MGRRACAPLAACLAACLQLHGASASREPGAGGAGAAADSLVLVQGPRTVRQPQLDGPAVRAAAWAVDVDGCRVPPGDPRAYDGACAAGAFRREVEGACEVRMSEPESDEKEVYFLRHARPECCFDCGLEVLGRQQCEDLKTNNHLLTEGPRSVAQRVQVVFMSPTTRTMETALRIFGDLNVSMVIDGKLVEFSPHSPCVQCAETMLSKSQHPELVEQYRSFLASNEAEMNTTMDTTAPSRVQAFKQQLLERPEQRIVVVAHFGLLGQFRELGMNCMEMGETIMETELDASGRWYQLTESSCGGRRRRWMYGNLQKKVD
mmetsp:Transcript_49300/g.152313  ORF Transcript_49300/g.152313 Transcript_49300/m.152313 type:complete len:319 (+) Transcript_49300:88-1044(+)